MEIAELSELKKSAKKITMLSVPDFYSARLVDEVGVHCILIGDSLGKHIHGESDVFSVAIGDIVYYTKIVRRAVQNALIVADLPYSAYELGPEEAVKNATILMEVGGAQALKLEGGEDFFPCVEAIVKAGLPLMGHIGLKGSFFDKLGGLPITEADRDKDWDRIIDMSLKLEKIGVFALMLECVPSELGRIVSERLKIPVIGQGAGHLVDGQSLIFHDMMGFHEGYKPKFMKKYARLSQVMSSAVKSFVEDVHSLRFPGEEHEY